MKNSEKITFAEDILSQSNFEAKDLIKAKFKHPIKHWFKVNSWLLINIIELKISDVIFSVRNLCNPNK